MSRGPGLSIVRYPDEGRDLVTLTMGTRVLQVTLTDGALRATVKGWDHEAVRAESTLDATTSLILRWLATGDGPT